MIGIVDSCTNGKTSRLKAILDREIAISWEKK
jgi:hypothetical protein